MSRRLFRLVPALQKVSGFSGIMSMCMCMSMLCGTSSPRELAMKSARLQVLTTPAFRDWLRKEARDAGVSVAELVRTRCQRPVSDEEKVLADLTSRLRKEVVAARAIVRRNLEETRTILSELRERRKLDTAQD